MFIEYIGDGQRSSTCHYIQVHGIIIMKNVFKFQPTTVMVFRIVDIERWNNFVSFCILIFSFAACQVCPSARFACPVQTNRRETPRHLMAANGVINAPSIWSAGRTECVPSVSTWNEFENKSILRRRLSPSFVITELPICFYRRARQQRRNRPETIL